MTIYEYAKNCYLQGKYPAMYVRACADCFLVYDEDWGVLSGSSKSFKSFEQANKAIDAARNKARKFLK